jgi:hypothetical protein
MVPLGAGFGVLLTVIPAQAAAPTPPVRQTVTIARTAVPPKLEDYLDGEKREGVRVEGFLQRDPKDLEPATERTEAYFSYDDVNLYAVFVCHASDPSQVRAHMSRREAIFSDDFVALFLDTFHDQQRAYEFLVSPLGVQADGIVTEGQNDDFSFDTLWHTRGRLTGFGYVVSMAIPFRSLRFPTIDGAQTWGISAMRVMSAKNEQAFWPGITRRISGFTSQFAELKGLEGVSPGRNVQVIPYGTFAAARFLDRDAAAYDTANDGRAGVDAKVVVRDAMTVDLTARPDFSQVESDEPQVTVNQRFEVFFPEKRPFFLENAAYFRTPITLFFSRRIRDPQGGVRLTGKVGGWAIGALTTDDRAPGRAVAADDPLHGEHAFNGVFGVRREFNGSSAGALVTTRDFGPSFNRIASATARLRLNPQWYFEGQAAAADTRGIDGAARRDGAYSADLSRFTRGFSYQLNYNDIGKDFRTALGFVPRTDIRQGTQYMQYRWHPKKGPFLSYGPNSFVQATWDHAGQLQDWTVRFPFQMDFKGLTGVFARRVESMERFGGVDFRENENSVFFYTSYVRWMDVNLYVATGARPNFYPGEGIAPFLADFRDAQVSLSFRPAKGLLLDETYIFSHLGAPRGGPHRGTVFDNHIARSRVNYQFTRELSLRAILDYNGVLANSSLVALDRTKRVSADFLLTYLVNPGTALYVGYTDGYENVAFDRITGVSLQRRPTTSTGRQFFVKTSYLFRF